MAISFIRGTTANFTGTTTVLTAAAAPAVGNLVTVAVVDYDAFLVSSITQTGVTWSRVVSQSCPSPGSGMAEIWYGVVSGTAGTSITVAYGSAVSIGGVMGYAEWTGNAASPLDQSGATTGTAQNFSGPSLTPAAAGDLNLLVVTTEGNVSSAVGSGWTELGSFSADSGGYADAAYLINAGSGAIAGAGSCSGGSGTYATVGAAFKVPASVAHGHPLSISQALQRAAVR